ncbi:Nif3-like dinuclear metal center hexameric protein [Nocardioides sp. WL0053]|uniref:GTP cyclohydrolase 1 type 2 homolog n=1 Tax=Nocardioides jiangsuensis TaxID=2866161 RepID=A0ABS7RPA0_9ACTN|nr:Nif3-like dinuclear metal center hexameric protein [Nocardioides jiangsuensis]MBY9076891.1 Nif3-like dinuclear metal center hexameric protein [Nocardioides jiangsuensis]
MPLRLRDVTGRLDDMYPQAWAADWDAVGLVCGDPDQEVRRVMFAVDPVPAVVEEALAWGADLLVVHHPLLLTPVSSVAADSPKGCTLHRLVREGCALFTAHTNADAPSDGVNESLALALGIVDPAVIAPEGDGDASATVNKIVTFAPHEDAGRIRDAMTSAGAGRIGDYDSCTFTVEGEGRFRPLDGATPAVGRVGEVEVVAESRIEAVVPRDRRDAVVAALRAVHPYEEPAYDVLELVTPPQGRPTRGHGRIGRLAEPTTLRGFAEQVRRALPESPHGVRVAGDPDRPVETVAVTSGAGDFLLDTVLGTGADVYVTSDLRHHRAGEFLEHGGPSLVDVAHWSAEWTWLPVVERKLLERLAERGDTVDTHVSTTCTDPWTFRL